MNTNRPATILFVFIFLVIQTISLIYYHNRVMNDLSNFLIFLEENDTTLAFTKKRVERSFAGLVSQLDKINVKLQMAKIERERQYHYLQAIVKQVDTGIISYDQDGKIEIFNKAARELLGIKNLNNIANLDKCLPGLNDKIIKSRKSYSSALKIMVNGSEKFLSVKSGALKFDNKWVRLISFQNIKSEIEAGEFDAWRKLLRIQRHEIINSLTPISTLTTAIKRRFVSGNSIKSVADLTDEQLRDALNSVDVIEERSKGLIDFIERFKGITDIPGIKTGTVNLKGLFNTVCTLFEKEISGKEISIRIRIIPESLIVNGDEKLLAQVLINLVKNSIEAIEHQSGRIELIAFRDSKGLIIQVTDNGKGIYPSALESIFVPSYTTKENGSGIGLSISRQIIQLHRGTIEVRSVPDKETSFEIILPD
jgi:nitrogen fixation/metabolism regulation signal transduction histidine kinase